MKSRCAWVGKDPLMVAYHDREWGLPLHNDNKLFEFLCLEGAQAGLSWSTVLNKRQAYRRAFHGFDPYRVASYDEPKIQELLQNQDIIRNNLKIRAFITNANRFLETQSAFGSFDRYLWAFVNSQPIQNHWKHLGQIPTTSPESVALSKDMRRRGFKFVGPIICYALMQAIGMVNDHTVNCFRHQELKNIS
ncbi:MAG: DNA-3-methyladenine glycosylase I [Deltaproteobacteria bacterium]|jgi:DNA-3-methyladenine glycosylase I|nr:DNA-3-methyladenine glycosylase I [Deltaproteobacteria bacterium]